MRLLSYNIHKGIGGRDRRYRLERIVQVIEAENPDVICLQEVDRHVRERVTTTSPGSSARRFDATAHLYQLNVRFKSGGYGNLVLSRWPLRTSHQISLRRKRRKPRGAQLAVIESPEGPLHLVHWHLGLAERERHWQVKHLLDHSLVSRVGPLADLDRRRLQRLAQHPRPRPVCRTWLLQVTAPRSRFRSFPAYWPVVSLDKAFARGPIAIRHARIVHSRLARDASDHLPLVVDFHLRHPAAR